MGPREVGYGKHDHSACNVDNRLQEARGGNGETGSSTVAVAHTGAGGGGENRSGWAQFWKQDWQDLG